MDLGLTDRRALVAASTQGLGFACALALAREGAIVAVNGRESARVEDARARIQAEVPHARTIAAPGDLTASEGRRALTSAIGEVDVLVTNNAGPALGGPDEWTPESLHTAVDTTTVPAVELMRQLVPGMRERGFGRVVHITSAMVVDPAPELGVSAAARSALTALSVALASEAIADGVAINMLLPGRFDTPRQDAIIDRHAAQHGIERDEARRRSVAGVPAGRLGDPAEFGATCAFLCSVYAGYLSGRSILIDGGTYGGLR